MVHIRKLQHGLTAASPRSNRDDNNNPGADMTATTDRITDTNSIKSIAQQYIKHGLCPIPTVQGEKRPVGNWKEYQDRFPTDTEWESWEAKGHNAIGVVCGSVSGNLLVLDFDKQGEAFKDFKTKVPVILWGRLVIEQSPSGGYHVYVRAEQAVKTERLASYQDDDGKWKPLIETRGEGGFCVCFPTPGYTLIQGDFSAIPMLSSVQITLLLNAARQLDRKPEVESDTTGTSKPNRLQRARESVREALKRTGKRVHPASLTFDQVKTRARGKWKRVLECLCPDTAFVTDASNRWHTCPCCQKAGKFRLFDDFNDTGTCICYKCHEKAGDGIATVAWLFDCPSNEARELLSDLLQTDLMK